MGWKYIVVRAGNQDIPVLFPDSLVHQDVAERICAIKDLRDRPGGSKTIAAGSLCVMAHGVGGDSETLKLTSRGDIDQNLIDSFEYGARGIIGHYE